MSYREQAANDAVENISLASTQALAILTSGMLALALVAAFVLALSAVVRSRLNHETMYGAKGRIPVAPVFTEPKAKTCGADDRFSDTGEG